MEIKEIKLTNKIYNSVLEKFKEYAKETLSLKQDLEYRARAIYNKKKRVGIMVYKIVWNSIYLQYFIIDRSYRRKGYGSYMLKNLEEYAKKNKMHLIYLETFSYQARDFYKKYGYKENFKLEGFSNDISLYFFSKTI